MDDVIIYIPSSVDLEALVEKGNLSINPFKQDKLAYVMHSILDRASVRKDEQLIDDYVPINASILKRFIGNDYHDYLQLLLTDGILECNGHYITGEQSMGYRFTALYKGEIEEYNITDFTLRRKVKGKSVRERRPIQPIVVSVNASSTNPNSPPPSFVKLPDKSYNKGIYKWYNDGKLVIDGKLARQYASAVWQYKKSDKKRWDVSYPSGDRKNPWYQYTNMSVNIGKIERGEFGEHFDGNVHRFHSVLTYMKKDIRNALEYDGQKLVAIDLCNSQPYLSTVLFQDGFWDGKKSQLSLFHLSTPLSSLISHKLLPSFIMITESASNSIPSKVPADIIAYKDAVSNGKFYEDFQALILKNTGKSYDRDTIKIMMFEVLFTDNRYMGQIGANKKRLFKASFPTVYDIFSRLKRLEKRKLPILLQQIESYIFTKRIGLRLAREHPNIPFWTIHDSVVTTVSNADIVEKIAQDELLKCIGLPPTLKREYWYKCILKAKINWIKSQPP